MAETFHVQRAVAVIARVRVPPAIAARDHDEKFALRGTPNPQRQPKVGVFADRHRVPMFTRNWSKLHKADLGGGRAALSHLLESIAPHCQFVRTEARGVKPLMLEPALERAQIVFMKSRGCAIPAGFIICGACLRAGSHPAERRHRSCRSAC